MRTNKYKRHKNKTRRGGAYMPSIENSEKELIIMDVIDTLNIKQLDGLINTITYDLKYMSGDKKDIYNKILEYAITRQTMPSIQSSLGERTLSIIDKDPIINKISIILDIINKVLRDTRVITENSLLVMVQSKKEELEQLMNAELKEKVIIIVEKVFELALNKNINETTYRSDILEALKDSVDISKKYNGTNKVYIEKPITDMLNSEYKEALTQYGLKTCFEQKDCFTEISKIMTNIILSYKDLIYSNIHEIKYVSRVIRYKSSFNTDNIHKTLTDIIFNQRKINNILELYKSNGKSKSLRKLTNRKVRLGTRMNGPTSGMGSGFTENTSISL